METADRCCIVLLFLSILAGNLKWSDSAICEPIRISMCNWLPYNLTRMPNLLFHSAQRNAELVIEQYQQLVDTKCSEDLLFFLCAMFAPMCPMGFRQDVIPPCRCVCLRARAGCEPIMNNYNVSWPKDLDCKNLPLYDRGVCISPESIISTAAFGPSTPQIDRQPSVKYKVPRCDCPHKPSQKLKDAFTSGQYHYAMKAEFRHAEMLRDGGMILYVLPQSVFYHRRVRIPGVVTRLWVDGDCVCGRLNKGDTYLFMGTERRTMGKLMFNKENYVDKWRDRNLKRLQSWKKKMFKARNKRRHLSKGRDKKRNRQSQEKTRDKKRKKSRNNKQ